MALNYVLWKGVEFGLRRGGVAAKTCAAIGRSERRVIIAPRFARVANRPDTSPVRLARASPGIDSDAAPRFPASRNPMTAQVLPLSRRGTGIAAKRPRPSGRGGCRRVASSPGRIAVLPAPGSCDPPGFVGPLGRGCESSPPIRGGAAVQFRGSGCLFTGSFPL